MLYAHYFRTIDCNGVQSLDYMICVEVEQGKDRPYKNTNLRQEVLSMRLPSTWAREQVLSNTFIYGAHMVLAGHARGNCIFCTKTLLLMSSPCRTLLDVYALTYTSISAKRCTSHAGVVRQSWVPGLKPWRDLEQWTLVGIWPHTKPLLFSVFPTKPTCKIWPSWALLTLSQNYCRKWVTNQSTNNSLTWRPSRKLRIIWIWSHAHSSQINSIALALTVNTLTTDGNQSLCSVTSTQVESD